MARDHARIQVAIWSDPEFRALDRDDQRMYLLLLSQARLTYCGTLDYMPGRIAALAADDKEENVENAVWRLVERQFIVVDHDTHELLIRSFVRHDGLLKTPNVTKAMLKDRASVISDKLRAAIDLELRRAYKENPDASGWAGMHESFPDVFKKVTGRRSPKGSGNGSPKGSGNGSPKGSERGSAK